MAAGAASFRVTFESEDEPGVERELWSLVLRGNDRPPGEVVLPLPGPAGKIARVGLLVGSVNGGPFAWGRWRAPRILGRGGADPLVPGKPSPAQDATAGGLRVALKNANVVLVILDAARAREFGAYGYGRVVGEGTGCERVGPVWQFGSDRKPANTGGAEADRERSGE